MSAFLSSYGFVLNRLLINVFNIKKKNIETNISADSLLSTTFKIPEKNRYSIVKAILYLLKSILKTQVMELPGKFSKTLIFDAADDSVDLRKKYVTYFSGHTEIGFVDYKHLICYPSLLKKISWSLLFFLSLIIIIPCVCFANKKKRASISLLIEEVIVLSNLSSICFNCQIQKIYFFSIYEVYSNLFSEALMRNGIEIVKIPSEVPLALWNKKIVASTLVVCNAYQYEEIEAYKESMIFEKTEFWGPELILEVKDYYKNLENENDLSPEFGIGFYSTGGWLRKLLGHIDQGYSIEEKEMKVKLALKDYARKNNIKLGIFLHPREKKKEFIEKTISHYKEIFEGVNYSFMPFDMPNNKLFNKVDLAIAFSSTIMFERLYCGYKCMFVPFGMEGFPLSNSPLKNVCIDSEEEFESKLSWLSELSVEDYFSKNKLEVYSRLKHLS
jgi:hypothetical protein